MFDLTTQNLALWDRIFGARAWGRYPPEELIRFIARTYREPAARRSIRILEMGCGPGANIWYLVREGFKVSGIDGSKNAIKIAAERLEAEGLANADLRVGNFASLPWVNETFDAVIDIEALSANLVPVIQSTILEVYRVLKPGGWYFGKMFGTETTGILSGRLLEPRTTENATEGPLADIGSVHAFDEQEIRTEFAGFSELRLDWVRRSDGGGAHQIFEWLVQARR